MADLPPPDLMSPPSDLVGGGGPPPDLMSPPDDLQDVPQGQGSVSRETPIAPQKATLAAPMAAMGPGDYTSLTKGSYYVGGDGGIYQKGTAPGGKDAFIKKPTADTGLTGALTEGIKAGISGVKQTGQSLAGQAPTDLVGQPQSLASQPMTWGDFVHPAALAQKILYSLAQGSPTIAGGIAGGMAGAAIPGAGETGIPEVAGGALGAGAGSMVQSLGPYYAAALKANPGNPDAAFDQALKQAGTEGAISGVGWAAFGFAPFKRAVSNLLLQAFGVQPSITAAGHAVQNVEAGRPAGEGVAQDIPGSVVSTIIPAAGHAAFHAAARAVPKANDILENIASGKPANAPPEGPPSDLQPEPPQGVAPAQTPSQAPQTGEVVGLRFKSGPPQRGTVDHYFDNGNAVRLRMDDGSVQDITTADFLRNRAEPPQPMQPQGPATRGPQLQPDQRPTPPADIFDQWDQPQERPVAPRPAPLGGDMLNALDHADSLTEAARLRRLVGQPGEQNVPPNAYTHPLAGEPAADLGELAAARVAQPGLYQGDYGRTTPESPKTLQIQQDQLVNGDRQAMLFPANAAAELPLPPGMARTVTPDGIFHFDPNKVAPEQIAKASQDGTLNSVLNLGPYSKNEVMARTAQGEKPLVVVERAPDGTEIRAAAGTDQTAADQLAYFNSSKAPDSTVGVEDPQAVIQRRLADKPDPYALEDVARSRQPLPKAPSLFDRIRELGGIKDDGQGDVNRIMRDYRRPGMRVLNSNEPMARRVVRPDGLSPERIRAALQGEHWWGKFEDQYGPDAQPVGSYPGDDIRDLYDLMDRQARGEPVYHPESQVPSEIEYRRQLDEDMGRAGVGASDSDTVAARKLANYRQTELADQAAWERSQAAHQGISPEAGQELEGHGYEPGADVGAEFENAGRGQEGPERPEDWLEEPARVNGVGEQPPGAESAPPEEYLGGRQTPGSSVTGELFDKPYSQSPESVPVPVRAVAGTGPLQTRGLAEGIEANAIEKGLTDGFGDLPEYRQVSMADQAAKAADFINQDYDAAKDVAMGRANAPKGLLPESVLVGVEKRATAEGDVQTLHDLATGSKLISQATTMGQRIRTLGERDPLSPVTHIQDVQDARTADLKARKIDPVQAKAAEVSNMKAEVKRTAASAKKPTWDNFIQQITCR